MADLGSIARLDAEARDVGRTLQFWAKVNCYGVDNFQRSAYMGLHRELRGTVKNSSGTGISRRVIAIDLRTGSLRGSVVSESDGTFAMRMMDCVTSAVTVIAIPDPADDRNVVALEGVIPVAPLTPNE